MCRCEITQQDGLEEIFHRRLIVVKQVINLQGGIKLMIPRDYIYAVYSLSFQTRFFPCLRFILGACLSEYTNQIFSHFY